MSKKARNPKPKSPKPKDTVTAGANPRLAQQTRKQLAKHYASKYKVRPR